MGQKLGRTDLAIAPWTPRTMCELRRAGYDGTITLEVFSPDRHHLAYSRDLLQRLWDETSVAASRTNVAVNTTK